MLKIEITEMGGSAFGETQESKVSEVCWILQEVKHQIRLGRTYGPCMDSNGNKVGEWSLD
jgi:hypothetical protein